MDAYFIPHRLHVSVLVLSLRCTSVTLNTQKQVIDGHVQISQSNNHMFICLSSLMISNESSEFNQILKNNKDACDIAFSSNKSKTSLQTKQFYFLFLFFYIYKWKQMVSKLSTRNNTKFIKQSILPQLKVDIVLNVQTNAYEYKRQVFKWKYKGKWKKAPDMMINSSSYFLQNG